MTETEKPDHSAVDTAAIRAGLDEPGKTRPHHHTMRRLCDALDAAQARADDLAAEVERSKVALRSAEARAAWSGHQCESLTRENGTLRMERDRGWERAEAAEAECKRLAETLTSVRDCLTETGAKLDAAAARAAAAEADLTRLRGQLGSPDLVSAAHDAEQALADALDRADAAEAQVTAVRALCRDRVVTAVPDACEVAHRLVFEDDLLAVLGVSSDRPAKGDGA